VYVNDRGNSVYRPGDSVLRQPERTSANRLRKQGYINVVK